MATLEPCRCESMAQEIDDLELRIKAANQRCSDRFVEVEELRRKYKHDVQLLLNLLRDSAPEAYNRFVFDLMGSKV